MFVSHEIALELKKLGFDEPCFGYYLSTTLFISNDIVYNSTDIPVIKAPTFSQAFDFFEKEYKIFLEREVVTTPNEILDIIYRIKSWRFAPITIEFENPYDCFDKNKSELESLRNMINIINNLKK